VYAIAIKETVILSELSVSGSETLDIGWHGGTMCMGV
jgi:hypothetical protein